MGKHTPGPWHIDPKYPLTIRPTLESPDPRHPGKCPVANINIVDLGRLYGAYGSDAPIQEEALANARLIAAAPDLLAACEAFVEIMDAGFGFPDREKLVSLYALKAKSAIAKAKEATP